MEYGEAAGDWRVRGTDRALACGRGSDGGADGGEDIGNSLGGTRKPNWPAVSTIAANLLARGGGRPQRSLVRRLRRLVPQRRRHADQSGYSLPPWPAGGLSRLSRWFVKLGILPERSRPVCPRDNVRHERMHRTLELATARLWQRAFDAIRREYSEQRPHEGLGNRTPQVCDHASPQREVEGPTNFHQRTLRLRTARVAADG
jgi:transposase InsO family protein